MIIQIKQTIKRDEIITRIFDRDSFDGIERISFEQIPRGILI